MATFLANAWILKPVLGGSMTQINLSDKLVDLIRKGALALELGLETVTGNVRGFRTDWSDLVRA
jgi:hypothetical protein